MKGKQKQIILVDLDREFSAGEKIVLELEDGRRVRLTRIDAKQAENLTGVPYVHNEARPFVYVGEFLTE